MNDPPHPLNYSQYTTILCKSAAICERLVPRKSKHIQYIVLRSFSYSLPREHGMPPSYTRLIGCDRHAHITLLHAERRLPSSYSRTGFGGTSTPMGGSYLRIKRYSRTGCGEPSTPMGGSYLRIKRYSRTGCGGPSTPMGGSYLRIKRYSRAGCGEPSTPMGGSYLRIKRYSRTGCGEPSTPMGGSYLRIKHPPLDYFLQSKKSG